MSDEDRYKPAHQVVAEQENAALLKLREKELALVKRDIDIFYKGLVTDPQNNPGRIPENIFVELFLPYFRGDKKFEDRPELLGHWYAIAGWHGGEVSVIDKFGNELFRVPPYMNHGAVDPTHNKMRQDMSLYDIDGISEGMSRTSPLGSARFRAEKMDEKLSDMLATGDQGNSILNRWAKIFERYETASAQEKLASVGSTNSPTPSTLSEDDLEF
jgi:hypothetical protein